MAAKNKCTICTYQSYGIVFKAINDIFNLQVIAFIRIWERANRVLLLYYVVKFSTPKILIEKILLILIECCENRRQPILAIYTSKNINHLERLMYTKTSVSIGIKY